MNKDQIKDIIDEIIYEAVIGKNPFKVGDLVKLRPDVLDRHVRRGNYVRNQWRETLQNLVNKTGKITRVSDSKHVNVTFKEKWKSKDEHNREYEVDTIGIDYTELVPDNQTVSEAILEFINPPSSSTPPDKFAAENPELIKAMRDWVKDIVWKDVGDESDVDELSNAEILRGVERHYQGGIKQFIEDGEPLKLREAEKISKNEGFGYVHDKDMKKDPKHITGERWRIKFQSAGDLKKHGTTEKSPVNESVSINDIREVIKELLSEMWAGWEEEEEGVKENAVDFFTPDDDYFESPPQIPGTEKLQMAKPPKKVPPATKTVPKSNEPPEQLRARLLAKLYGKDGGEKKIQESTTDKLKKKVVSETVDTVKKYIIWAKSGPSTVYYVNSQTQGERMIQNAQSMATKFDTEEQVRRKILELRQKYKGIKKFDFEIVAAEPGWEDVWKSRGPKEIKLGHQVFKPVKRGEEYVVRWATDGKTDEGKTYYTDDREDANGTYREMIKQADELNKQNLQEEKSEKCYAVFCIKKDGTKWYLTKNYWKDLTLTSSDDNESKSKIVRYKTEEEVRKELARQKATMHHWKWDFEPISC